MDKISEKELIAKLQKEGFKDARVCPLPPGMETPEHTHDQHTVHIILDGELIITDVKGTRTYKPGDRGEFAAGTKHKAKSKNGTGNMITGIKE
jgi:quercetin dioxygenase-like cupin family protein